MAYKDYDSKYNRGMARERIHASNSSNNYNGDNPRGSRPGRMSGPGRFGESRSTQDFENANALRYNRGREGDQEWRLSDFDAEDYMVEQQSDGYGERYGFSAEGRAHYDPDINRGWEDPIERASIDREERRRTYAESANDGYDRDEHETVPYASHKNGQRAHGRNVRHEYMGDQRSYSDRDAQRSERQSSMRRTGSASKVLVPLLVLGGFAVLAGVMQAFVPRVVDAIGGIFRKD